MSGSMIKALSGGGDKFKTVCIINYKKRRNAWVRSIVRLKTIFDIMVNNEEKSADDGAFFHCLKFGVRL